MSTNLSKPFIFGNGYRIKKNVEQQLMKKKNTNKSPLPKEILEKKYEYVDLDCFESPILIWINTYNRVDELELLLKDIDKNKENFKIKIFVLDDCSSKDYTKMLRNFSGKLDIIYHKVSINHGKKLYWKLCNYTLERIRLESHLYRYFIKLDDDCRIINNFFTKCVNIWESINDPQKICLNFRLDSREGRTVWTNVRPRKMQFKNIPIYRSQWVDMDFFCQIAMFQALRFHINPQPINRWLYNKSASSGVGRDISIRLHRMGFSLYLTTESLVNHDHHDSKMNPEERGVNPLVTKPITNLQYGMPE